MTFTIANLPNSKWYIVGVEWGDGLFLEAFCGCYAGKVKLLTFSDFKEMKRKIIRDKRNDSFFYLKSQKRSSKKRGQG